MNLKNSLSYNLNSKYNIVFFTITSIIYLNFSYSQSIIWSSTFGNSGTNDGRSVIQTLDGGFLLFGFTNLTSCNYGDFDVELFKFDHNAQLQWKRCFGGSGSEFNEYGNNSNLYEDTEQNLILCTRTFSNDFDIMGNHGSLDGMLMKISPFGELINSVPAGGFDGDGFFSLSPTLNGNYLACGYTRSECHTSNSDGYVIEFDSDNKIINSTCLAGINHDGLNCIISSHNGKFIGVGYSNSNFPNNTNHGSGKSDLGDILAFQLESNLAVENVKLIGGSGDDFPNSIIETKDGNYIIAGYTNSIDGDFVTFNQGNFDAFILKCDKDFNVKWIKTFGGSKDDKINKIIEDDFGNFVFSGTTSSINGIFKTNHGDSDGFIGKISKDGNLIWTKCIGGSADDQLIGLSKGGNNSYLTIGSSLSSDGNISNTNLGQLDYWLVKFQDDDLTAVSEKSIINNPFIIQNKTLVINNDIKKISKITIYNLTGAIVKYATNVGEIELNGLNENIYFMQIETSSNLFSYKISII